jgi:hypothetical protein
MEARVRELRRSSETEPAAAPASPSGTSKQNPKQPERDGSASPSSTVPTKALPEAKGGRSHWKADSVVPTMVVDATDKEGNEVIRAVVPTMVVDATDKEGNEVIRAVVSTMVVDAREKEVIGVFRARPSTTEDQAEGSLV